MLEGEVDGKLLGELLGNVDGELLGELLRNVDGELLGELLGNVDGELLGELLGEAAQLMSTANFPEDTILSITAILATLTFQQSV